MIPPEKLKEWRELAEKANRDDSLLTGKDVEFLDIASSEIIPALLDEVERLREALKFYADPFTWSRVSADAQHMGASPGFDFNSMYGEKARVTLGGRGSEPETHLLTF